MGMGKGRKSAAQNEQCQYKMPMTGFEPWVCSVM